MFEDNIVKASESVRNLGILFDRALIMEKHSVAVAKTCYFHLRNIGRIRPFITDSACKTLINSMVTSRLDYSNALLTGTSGSVTDRLQLVQNTAAIKADNMYKKT